MYKLTNLALAMLMMLLLAACGNDDETTNPSDGLEDTWTLVSVDIDVQSSTMVSGQTIISTVEATGGNPAYDLTLGGGDWTTDGSYEMTVLATVDGTVASSGTDTYSSVMGSGVYTNDATTITVDGSFFDFEYNGVSYTSASGEQTANYTINSDNQLVISQNDTSTSNTGGATVTSNFAATSVWDRK